MSETNALVESALFQAVSSTLENMAFEQADRPQADSPPYKSENDNIWARLPILKPTTGEISLQISLEYAQKLAQSLFEGSDNITNDELVKDTLAEVLNTIAGRFMTQLIPAKDEFELGLPRVGISKLFIEDKDFISCDFDVGGHLLTVFLSGVISKATGDTDIKEDKNHENFDR
jgi:CheY-specific phosphatase CheX